MVDSEREMLQEQLEKNLNERKPFDSSRQATYEDTVTPDSGWDCDDAE